MRGWACPACHWKNAGRSCERCGTRKATKRVSISSRCDAMAAWLCKAMAGFKCARCGRPGTGPSRTAGLEWSHRIKRRHRSVRWDLDNCDCLCSDCHRYFETHPVAYIEFWRQRGGDPESLEQRGNQEWDKDYGTVLLRLSEQTREMRERLG